MLPFNSVQKQQPQSPLPLIANASLASPQSGFSAIIPDITKEIETKSIAERTLIDETGKGKKKKKKNKKITVDQQTKAIEKLGNCFPVKEFHLPTTKKVVSIFEQNCFSKLTVDERNLLIGILGKGVFTDNSNLFQAFMVDLHEHWETILSLIDIYDQDTRQNILNLHQGCDIMKEIFAFELYIMARKNNKSSPESDWYSKQCFQNVNGIKQWLDRYNEGLFMLYLQVASVQKQRTQILKNIPAIWKTKFNLLNDSLILLHSKVGFLTKCFKEREPSMLFFNEQITSWSESNYSSFSGKDKLNNLSRLSFFIKKFLSMERISFGQDASIALGNYLDVVDRMLTGKLTQQLIADFMLSYKKYALCAAKQEQDNRLLAKVKSVAKEMTGVASSFPCLAEDNFCLLRSDRSTSFLVRKSFTFEIVNKWASDLHQTIYNHFSTELNKTHVITPETYIKRLMMMLDLIKFGEPKHTTDPVDLEKTITDPFLNSMQEQIQKLTGEFELQFKNAFALQPLKLIELELFLESFNQLFQLSKFLLILLPLSEEISTHEFPRFQLDNLRHTVLRSIRAAKQNHQLDQWEPSKLKEEIQGILFKQSLQICAFTMIIADVNVLFSQSYSNDILHLFPNDVVRWLDLTGFDEIFAESDAAIDAPADEEALEEVQQFEELQLQDVQFESQAETPLSEIPDSAVETPQTQEKMAKPQKAMGKPKKEGDILPHGTVPQKQSQAQLPKACLMPERQDFQETVKRPLIVKMLEQMGFVYVRTGRHAIYHHSEATGQVVVPHSVQARGTRGSIYNQAMEVLGRRDGKED